MKDKVINEFLNIKDFILSKFYCIQDKLLQLIKKEDNAKPNKTTNQVTRLKNVISMIKQYKQY